MHNKITLKEHQKIMFDILVIFTEFCAAHKLTYFLDAGTLLGAVRHGGFIPWDNDVDVCMPRVDYEKLLILLKDNKHYINDYIKAEVPEETLYTFTKIGDTRTRLVEFPNKVPRDSFIYIDVFPKDGIANLSQFTKLLCKISRLLYYIHWFNNFSMEHWIQNKKGIKKWFGFFVKKMTRDLNWAFKLQKKLINVYINRNPYDSCKYLTTLVNGEFNKCTPSECFSKGMTVQFEGKDFIIPHGYDTYLRILYPGNYMALPAIEERHVHRVLIEWRNTDHFNNQEKK